MTDREKLIKSTIDELIYSHREDMIDTVLAEFSETYSEKECAFAKKYADKVRKKEQKKDNPKKDEVKKDKPKDKPKDEPKDKPKDEPKKDEVEKDEKKNLLDEASKRIDVEDKYRMAFVKNEDGKEVKDPRHAFNEKKKNAEGKKTAGQLQEGSYFTREDLDALILKTLKENKRATLEGLNGEIVTIKRSLFGKKISKGSIKKINKMLAEQAQITLPAEKDIPAKKNGWFEYQAEGIQAGDHEDFSGKTQLAKDKREAFIDQDTPTTYYGLKSFTAGEAKEKGKGKVPGWVKGVAIAGGVVAGVAALGMLAPYIMPAMSTLWWSFEGMIGAQSALHGVNIGLAALNGVVTPGAAATFAGGIWTSGAGAVMNALLPHAGTAIGALGATAVAAMGAAGATFAGIGVGKTLTKGLTKLSDKFSKSSKESDGMER